MSSMYKQLGDWRSGAIFSEDEKYRYCLWRAWLEGPTMVVVGLNPSTANHEEDDATIAKLTRIAKQRGYARLAMLNLFAYRSTDPKKLREAFVEPIGARNDHFLMMAFDKAETVIAAWGNHGTLGGRDKQVIEMMNRLRCDVKCFGLNKNGTPKHPLYQKDDTSFVQFQC